MKIEFENQSDLEVMVGQGLRATIMSGAVSHIVKELTPERLNVFVNEALERVFENFRLYEIESQIKKLAEKQLEHLISQPEAQERIRQITAKAFAEYMGMLDQQVRERLGEQLGQFLAKSFDRNTRY
jgi:plasmid maintenance system killer protein